MHHFPATVVLSEMFLAQCSDIRDRIYSQLSLVEAGQRFHIDYHEDKYTLLL